MPPPGVCLNILEARNKREGYGSIDNPEKFLNQDFKQLKQYCLIQRVRYIDETFPPDTKSIGHGILKPSDLARVEWLRPAIIAPNPNLVLDGVSRFDFGQGKLGNCWFLASIGALTFQNDILKNVVPLEQTFNEDYCGLFHFRFWRFGKWVDVVIDDKLPTLDGRLIFVHSKDQNEFWPALLEKAYAKVCGSYTDMNAGTPEEAMMDFTGGVHMCIKLSEPPQNLWELMCRSGNCALQGCGTPQGETSPNGLVQGHAYTVTGVKQMMSQGKPVKLVRLWNPWGKGEWMGDWSDRMPLEDFCKFYTDLDICCPSPSFLDGSSSSHWRTSMYEGRWVAGSFWTNPQYRVQIHGGNLWKDGEKNVLVSLMQKPDKRNRHLVQNHHIGFSIYEVTEFISLKPGEYLIVPSTFNPNETASFILTIFSKTETHGYENSGFYDHDTVDKPTNVTNAKEDQHKQSFFHQHSDKYNEVDAEQLQKLLNEKILKGDLKSGGFTIDACRSMVALMDTSITGKLNGEEFVRLWNNIVTYKDIFFRTDVSRTGTLSLSELRNAIMALGMNIKDDMLNLMALRYGASSGHMTLESFISLSLRMNCVCNIFKQLSDGKSMSLQESEWLYISMYT
eukprot:superscaffoldBa00000658_g6375